MCGLYLKRFIGAGAFLSVALLSACNGGGSDGSSTSSNQVPVAGNQNSNNSNTSSTTTTSQPFTVTQVAAGPNFAIGLGVDLKVYAWGANNFGQHGRGVIDNTHTSVETQIDASTDWAYVAAGDNTAYAIKSNGSLYAWGENGDGQVGDGSTNTVATPSRVGLSTDRFSTVTGGYKFALAVRATDGTLWFWGKNDYGQLGNGSLYVNKVTPFQVGTDKNWVDVKAGHGHVLAIKNDGTIWAWGDNAFGQLGIGNQINQSKPVQVGTDKDWRRIQVGENFSMALKSDGSVWVWGVNTSQALGVNSTAPFVASPTQVGTDKNWTGISAGGTMLAAVKSDGTLWGWGVGAMGDGICTSVKTIPTKLSPDSNWNSVFVGPSNVFALRRGFAMWSWGDNSKEQTGRLDGMGYCKMNAVSSPV